MGTINQFACSHCNLVGKFKLIEPKSSPNTKGFAKEGFQNKNQTYRFHFVSWIFDIFLSFS